MVKQIVEHLSDPGNGEERLRRLYHVVCYSAEDEAGGLDLEDKRESWTFYF